MSKQDGWASERVPEPPAASAAVIDTLWGRLRLVVVIDPETVTPAYGNHAIKSAS